MSRSLSYLNLREAKELYPISASIPDTLFLTCGSFEERSLGSVRKLEGGLPSLIVVFHYVEPNQERENNMKEMKNVLSGKYLKQDSYHVIDVEHGKSVEAILDLHRSLKIQPLSSEPLSITLDITTFTKDLLINLMYYLTNIVNIGTLRLLYTVPGGYASPDEGWLSSGIKRIQLPPMVWNGWSPIKQNLLLLILGFEEMRAWSLIEHFGADENWIFITNPGSLHDWDTSCQRFNQRLLDARPAKGAIAALGASDTVKTLSRNLTKQLSERYNIFICPLGTKIQIVGVIQFCLSKPQIPCNIITTTVLRHNVPYYSWGVGSTFELYFPINHLRETRAGLARGNK